MAADNEDVEVLVTGQSEVACDVVGRAARGAGSRLALNAFPAPAVPAVQGGPDGEPGGDDAADWPLVCSAMDAAQQGGFHSADRQDTGIAQQAHRRAQRHAASAPGPFRTTVGADAPNVERTILLVEDDPIVEKAVSRMLERLGYIVIVARSAQEARKYADGSFAYALVDNRLPEPEGLELGHWLASLPHGISVAVYSGAFDLDLAVKVHQSGVLTLPRPMASEMPKLLAYLQARRQGFLSSIATEKTVTNRRSRGPQKGQPGSGVRAVVQARATAATLYIQSEASRVESAVETIVIALTPAERDILAELISAEGNGVSRAVLGRLVLDRTDAGADQSVMQHVSNLRGKLDEQGHCDLVRTTEDGKGYYLTHRVHLEVRRRHDRDGRTVRNL